MEAVEIEAIVAAQHRYFAGGYTLPVAARKEALARLYDWIKNNEKKIGEALLSDLGKSRFESYMCEVGMALSEISHMLRHVAAFARPKRCRTPLAQFPSKSYQLPTPRGTVLVMSPWNYPFLLTVGPLANALAAGNTVVLKPSAYSPRTSALLADMVRECFPPECVIAVTGGRQENACLLLQKFDMIFFTGSGAVGKEVLRHAAEHLTPAVLELGGKSPCIVDESARLSLAARRIVFGKLLNCGQTCVAPDFVLCHSRVKDELVAHIKREIVAQMGDEPLKNPEWGRMVNRRHFDRVRGLVDASKVVHGGEVNEETLQIAPTVMDNVTLDDAVMGEEIFGPVLPVLTFDNVEEIPAMLDGMQKPLALYLFSENKKQRGKLMRQLRFGGGCINDTVIHLATSHMGFGGVGESGMGAYHGKVGFDAFSHLKSVVDKGTRIDLPMRYHPYTKGHFKLLRLFLK